MTTKEPFRTGSGAQVTADIMHASWRIPYLQTGLLTSIALPFRHEDLAFIIALPMSTGRVSLSNLPDLCDVLDADEALSIWHSRSSTPSSRDFHVDRPFLWAVAHVPTKSIVMLGREDDPTA